MKDVVSGVQLLSAPTKNEYLPNEVLSVEGAVIREEMLSGAINDIDVTLDMVSGFKPARLGIQTIKVSYGEYEFSFEDLLEPGEEYNGGLLFNKFRLNPYDAYGFENIAKYNDYFRVTKLSVHFASNADSNFAPIILKYIPPTIGREITPQICMQATKTATSKDGAYMSLIMPDCLIRMNNEDGEEEAIIPCLNRELLCLNVDGYKFDYGTFVFYTRNPAQKVTFTLFWEIDYYSGVNYINIKETESWLL